MNEKQSIPSNTEEATAQDSGDGNIIKEPTPIEQANAAAERLEKANAKAEEIQVKARLGGVTDAGVEPEVPKEISDTEYMKEFVKNPTAFKMKDAPVRRS